MGLCDAINGATSFLFSASKILFFPLPYTEPTVHLLEKPQAEVGWEG